jgi:dynein heavy chain
MIPDMDTMRERLEMFMEKHNEVPNAKKLDLVLFDDAIRHLVRIARIIGMPRSSALLVGVGGSGKQSLTKLACFIARHVQATITISKFYKVADFLNDLKEMFIKVGKEGKKLTFVFTDSMVLYEDFLEYLNQILSTGEVAGLFSRDEKTLMAGDLRPIAKKEIPGFDDTNENLQKFLSDRIRDNFHIVLCFSPMNDKFKERARRFPSLVSGTHHREDLSKCEVVSLYVCLSVHVWL